MTQDTLVFPSAPMSRVEVRAALRRARLAQQSDEANALALELRTRGCPDAALTKDALAELESIGRVKPRSHLVL